MLDVMNIYLVIYKSIIYIYIFNIYTVTIHIQYIYIIYLEYFLAAVMIPFLPKKKWAFFCIGSVKSTQLFATE